MKINIKWKLLSRMLGQKLEQQKAEAPPDLFKPPEMLPGVAPAAEMAMDAAHTDIYAYLNAGNCGRETFPGFAYLAQLTQLPEYRMLSEKTADAMVRRWIKIGSKGKGNKSARIAAIEDALTRFNVRELYRNAAKYDGFFGRSQIFFDFGDIDGSELQIPLLLDKAKIGVGKLRCLTLVEAMYTYPSDYNSDNPLDPTFYVPQSWYVMGKKVHDSRLMTFVSKPLPNILKPAYQFCGMSVSQLCRSYVDNWKGTVKSVNRMINNYSKSGIKTDLSNTLSGDDDGTSEGGILQRAELYSAISENQGLMMLHKSGEESEEFFQFNTPLTTLDKLQAQAQEHMASVCNTPISVLLGITPAGLNASTDGEIRIWHERILDMQEILFRANLTKLINVLQLDIDGTIDPDIVFHFLPLWEQSEEEKAKNRKSDADCAAIYSGLGAISAEEVREKLASDPESGFTGLSGPAPDDGKDEPDDAAKDKGKE